MDALSEFHRIRMPLLNEPAEDEVVSEILEIPGDHAVPLARMYKLFDGEKNWGALFPGYRICSLNEVIALQQSTADSWEYIESDRGSSHPMRNFFPFLKSPRKTRIGLLADSRSTLAGYVIEYDYEIGNVRAWATTMEAFQDAFFAFSMRRFQSRDLANQSIRLEEYIFTQRDLDELTHQVGIVLQLGEFDVVDIESIW